MALYRTPRYEQDFIERVKYSRKRFDIKTAEKTYDQLVEIENKIESDKNYGTLDPEHHSSRFHFGRIENRSKVIFERFGDDVVMVMAGGDRMNWKKILQELEPYIERQIESAKREIEKNRGGHTHATNSTPSVSNQAVEQTHGYNPNNAGDVIRRLRPDLTGQEPQQQPQDKADPDRTDRDDR